MYFPFYYFSIVLSSTVITLTRNPQNDTKQPKATDINQETNQSLGIEAHTLGTNKKHFDTIRVICVT